jgi:hypothetical protein
MGLEKYLAEYITLSDAIKKEACHSTRKFKGYYMLAMSPQRHSPSRQIPE